MNMLEASLIIFLDASFKHGGDCNAKTSHSNITWINLHLSSIQVTDYIIVSTQEEN